MDASGVVQAMERLDTWLSRHMCNTLTKNHSDDIVVIICNNINNW